MDTRFAEAVTVTGRPHAAGEAVAAGDGALVRGGDGEARGRDGRRAGRRTAPPPAAGSFGSRRRYSAACASHIGMWPPRRR